MGNELGIAGTRGTMQRCTEERTRGFTLIEMLIAIAVGAIVTLFAVPSLLTTLEDNAMSAVTNQFASSLYFTRNEALLRRATVRMCKSASPTDSPVPKCSSAGTSGGSSGYESGWIIYVDTEPYDYQPNTADDVLQTVIPDRRNGLTIRGNTNVANQIAFVAMGNTIGTPSGLGNGTLVICDSRGWSDGGKHARVVVLSRPGRIRTLTGDQSSVTSC